MHFDLCAVQQHRLLQRAGKKHTGDDSGDFFRVLYPDPGFRFYVAASGCFPDAGRIGDDHYDRLRDFLFCGMFYKVKERGE